MMAVSEHQPNDAAQPGRKAPADREWEPDDEAQPDDAAQPDDEAQPDEAQPDHEAAAHGSGQDAEQESEEDEDQGEDKPEESEEEGPNKSRLRLAGYIGAFLVLGAYFVWIGAEMGSHAGTGHMEMIAIFGAIFLGVAALAAGGIIKRRGR